MKTKRDKFVNSFLGLPTKAELNVDDLSEIRKMITHYGVTAYFVNTIFLGVLALLALNKVEITYLASTAFVVNMLLPMPFLYMINKNQFNKVQNSAELHPKFPWLSGILAAITFYILMVVTSSSKVSDFWDMPTFVISVGFGLFMMAVVFLTRRRNVSRK